MPARRRKRWRQQCRCEREALDGRFSLGRDMVWCYVLGPHRSCARPCGRFILAWTARPIHCGDLHMAKETAQLAEYAVSLRYDDIPGDVVERAKQCIADTIATIIFGYDLPWSRIVVAFAQ